MRWKSSSINLISVTWNFAIKNAGLINIQFWCYSPTPMSKTCMTKQKNIANILTSINSANWCFKNFCQTQQTKKLLSVSLRHPRQMCREINQPSSCLICVIWTNKNVIIIRPLWRLGKILKDGTLSHVTPKLRHWKNTTLVECKTWHIQPAL